MGGRGGDGGKRGGGGGGVTNLGGILMVAVSLFLEGGREGGREGGEGTREGDRDREEGEGWKEWRQGKPGKEAMSLIFHLQALSHRPSHSLPSLLHLHSVFPPSSTVFFQ